MRRPVANGPMFPFCTNVDILNTNLASNCCVSIFKTNVGYFDYLNIFGNGLKIELRLT